MMKKVNIEKLKKVSRRNQRKNLPLTMSIIRKNSEIIR